MATKEELFRQRLMATFQLEAEEHIRGIIGGMSALEALLDDASAADPSIVEAVYRQFHSLKGASQAIGFDHAGHICQSAESIISNWKNNTSSVNRQDISKIIELAINVANELNIAVPGTVVSETTDSFDAYQAQRSPKDSGENMAVTERSNPSTLPAYDALQVLQDSAGDSKRGTTPQSVGGKPSKNESTFTNPADVLKEPKNKPDAIKNNILASITTVPKPGSETIRVASDKLDSLLRRGEQLVLARLNSRMRWTESQNLLASIHAMRKKWDENNTINGVMPDNSSEELRRFASTLQRHVRNLGADHHELNTQLQALLDEVKSARLAPVRPLLEEMEMAARRIARQLGKRVRITVQGGELELDRSIMEALKDPLIHLVRNALDHGLEQAEERRKSGKHIEGKLNLDVSSRGTGTMEFRVSDDGRGIQTEEVINVARRQGLIADGVEVNSLDLIFSSGVSTRSQVSSLSGRGLGMAIVREKVEALKGSVRVKTDIGIGTTFILSIPTSLATFEGLLVKEHERHLVFPLNGVEAVAKFNSSEIHSVEGSQVVSFRGSLAPVYRLGEVLSIPSIPGEAAPDNVLAIIVTAGGRKAAFLVDEILGVREVLSRDLGPQLRKVQFIIGACMIGYQQVVPVLNIADLLTHLRGDARITPVSDIGRVPYVLVADDSLTTRTLMRGLLEAANYKVKAASDGSQAWEMLQNEHFDIVVSDVDMPGITGLDLTIKIRSHPMLRNLPLILVTGQERPEDRQRGLKLGASSYILKSRFDEGVLLEAVERLVGEATPVK